MAAAKAGVKPETCAMLPSRVTITFLSAFEVSLRRWPAWCSTGADHQAFDDGVYASRTFTLLRFVLWVSSCPENRRVLLHHGVLACIREALAALRECRADVFGEDMLELLDTEHTSESVPDARTFDWISATQASADAYMAPGAMCQAEPTTKIAGCILFRLLMLLSVRLLDPEAKFAEHLKCAYIPEPESEFTMVDANEHAKGLLSEFLLAWQRLEVTPSRPRLGQAVLSLSGAIGSVLVSGWVDGHQLHQLNTAELIARPMHYLQFDEAYLAWRLLILLAEQHAEFAKWSHTVKTKASNFWRACTLSHAEYLRPYAPLYLSQQTEEQEGAVSLDDRTSLDAILAESHAETHTDRFVTLQRCVHIHTRGEFIDSAIEPAVLQKYVKGTGGRVETGTRLRRNLDTVVACLAQHGNCLPLPPYIRSSLATINHLLEPIVARSSPLNLRVDTTSTGRAVVDESDEVRTEHYSFLVTECVHFLWSVWRLPLCLDIMGAVFSSISAAAWDSMLSHMAAQGADGSSSAINPGHAADRVSDTTHRHILMLVGWLLMHSSPSNADGGRSMLPPSVCKLVFHKVMTTLASAGYPTAAPGSALDSSNGRDSDLLELSNAASLIAYRASQCLLLVCWHDVRRFRLLIHETQSIEYMLSVLHHLDHLSKRQSTAHLSDYVTQSLDNLSVVSLPDESVWNIADLRSLSHHSRGTLERSLSTTLFLLWASSADTCSACQLDTDDRTGMLRDERTLPGSDKQLQAQMLRVVWQLSQTSICKHSSSAEPIDCISALSDLSSSGNSAVSMVSKLLVTTSIRWLLASELNDTCATAYSGVDQHQLALVTKKWLALAVQWVLPTDISHTAAVKQHAQFLASLRTGLARAALDSQGHQHLRHIQARLVRCGILEDLLSSIQLATTIDLGCSSSGHSQFSSFGDDQASVSHSPEYELGVLVSESLRMLAFVVYDFPELADKLADIGGYRTVNTCLSRILASSAAAGAPIVEGVLALLSGLSSSADTRAMSALRVERKWIPTMTSIFSCLGLTERIATLRLVAQWCESSSHACWHLSQSTLPRQTIELLQSLLSELSASDMDRAQRYSCVSAYAKVIGRVLTATMSVSMCVSDLKLIFRTLVSGPGDPEGVDMSLSAAEVKEHTQTVRQMFAAVLTRCARHEAIGSYFSFGGRPAALRASHFCRVPERGFTFATWIRPDDALACSGQQHFLTAQLSGGGWSLPSTQPASPNRPTGIQPCSLSSESGTMQAFGTILHLSAARGNAFEILYNSAQRGLEIRLLVSGAKHVIKCADGLVGPWQWHSLAVSYVPAKRGWSPFGSSNIHVYLNSTLAYKGSVAFIEHSAYHACYIGGSPVVAADSSLASPMTGLTLAFSGRMSNVRMFDGPLRASDVELLHHIGPMLATQFRKSQASDPTFLSAIFTQTRRPPASASLAETVVEDVAG
ncbi:hypothetical protein IWW38_002100, partial [Coemansia aciculifera]